MARAILLIADIGGYTRFMKVHKINLAHAQYVIGRLMEAILDALGRGWKLSKLEGDAAFVYCTLSEGSAVDGDVVREQVLEIARAFRARKQQLVVDRPCSCDGCVQAKALTLKFVIHAGEVAFQRIKRLTELAGVDVILVHRLLKNSVPIDEYLLMSDAIHDRLAGDIQSAATSTEEDLEGLGAARLYYVDVTALGSTEPVPREPSGIRKVVQWLRMTASALPFMLGLRKVRLGDSTQAAICGPALHADE